MEALTVFRQLEDTVRVSDFLRAGADAYPLSQVEEKTTDDAAAEVEECQKSGDKAGQAKALLALGLGYLRLQKASDAGDALTEAAILFEELGDKLMHAYAMLYLVKTRCLKDNAKDAAEAAGRAALLFREAADKRGEAESQLMAAKLEDEAPEALRAGRAGLAIFRDLGDPEGEIKALLAMCDKQLDKEDPREALRFGSEAQALARKNFVARGEYAALRAVVQAQIDKGSKIEALREARDAVAWFQKNGDRPGQAAAQDVMVQAHAASGQKDEALRAGWESMQIFKDLGDRRAHASSLVQVALLHVLNGQEDWAIEALREARMIFEELADRRGEGMVQNALMHAHLQKNETATALAAGNEAQTIFRDAKDKRWMAYTLLTVCQVHRKTGQVQLAASSAQRARWLFEEVGDRKGQAAALLKAADVYSDMGALDRALRAAKKAQAALESGGYLKTNASAIQTVASVHMSRDEADEAITMAVESRTLCKRVDDRKGEGKAMKLLAEAHYAQAQREAAKMEKFRPAEPEVDPNPAPPLNYGMAAPNYHERLQLPDPRAQAAEHQYNVLKEVAERALKVAKEAVAFASKFDDKELFAETLHILGQVQIMNNQAEDALKSASHAMALGKERNDKWREAMSLILSAEAYIALGKNDEALHVAERGVRVAKKAGCAWPETYGNSVLEHLTGAPVGRPQQEEEKKTEDAAEEKQEETFVGLDPQNVRDQVREEVAQLIGLEEDSLFDDTPLMDSGLDSLSSVEFRNQLAKEFQMNLPATLTFDFPSIKALSGFIVEQSLAAAPKHLRDKKSVSVAAPKPKADSGVPELPAGAMPVLSKKGTDAKVKSPCIVGTWDNWARNDMKWDADKRFHHATVQLGINGWESFQILYEGDWKRCLYPEQKDACPHLPMTLLGPDEDGHGQNWTIGKHQQDYGGEGVCYQVRLYTGEDGNAEKVDWVRLGSSERDKEGALAAALPAPESPGPLGRRHPYLIGTWNNWGTLCSMAWNEDNMWYQYPLRLGKQGWESFQVLLGGEWSKCLHPERKDGCPHLQYQLCGPDEEAHGKNWTVGKHPLDNGGEGVMYEVRLVLDDQRQPLKIDWVRL